MYKWSNSAKKFIRIYFTLLANKLTREPTRKSNNKGRSSANIFRSDWRPFHQRGPPDLLITEPRNRPIGHSGAFVTDRPVLAGNKPWLSGWRRSIPIVQSLVASDAKYRRLPIGSRYLVPRPRQELMGGMERDRLQIPACHCYALGGVPKTLTWTGAPT